MNPDIDPGELSDLTRALRREVRRRRTLGEARVPRAEPVTLAPRAEPAGRIEPAPAPTPRRGAPKPVDPGDPDAPEAALRRAAAACPDLASLRVAVAGCTACTLCESRTQTVFSDGDGTRRVMFVGEAPGADEDREGVPFVGRAGRLLTDIIEKGMGIRRQEVTIANVLKCRPPGNRDPEPGEKRLCTAWLDRQIELVDPEVIIPLGRHAACHLLGREDSMGRLRGRVHRRDGRTVIPTYHPAFLLRSPHMKKDCWADIQRAMGEIGLERPG